MRSGAQVVGGDSDRPGRDFLSRLAVVLGRTVGELEEGMTSAELSAWLAWYRIGGGRSL